MGEGIEPDGFFGAIDVGDGGGVEGEEGGEGEACGEEAFFEERFGALVEDSEGGGDEGEERGEGVVLPVVGD